jgi:membrane-associated phospholipid phosphatase
MIDMTSPTPKLNRLHFVLFLALMCINMTMAYAQSKDIQILREIHNNHPQSMDPVLKCVTNTYPVIVVGTPLAMGITAYLTHNKQLGVDALEIGASALANAGAVLVVKYAVNRDRPFTTYPDIIPKVSESGPSFPSYHTSASFNTATALSLKYPKWYVIVPSYVWAGTVGYSRMHLGVHYPSDVAMGALMGIGSAWVTHRLNKWYQTKINEKNHGKTTLH